MKLVNFVLITTFMLPILVVGGMVTVMGLIIKGIK